MVLKHDEIFDYIDSKNTVIEVAWNLDELDEVVISRVYLDKNSSMREDELWATDYELAEDIVSYIENEFVSSEDFWLTKFGYNF